MSRTSTLWAAVAAIAFAAVTAAQPDRSRAPAAPGAGLPPTFGTYDMDRDGRITPPEASADPGLSGEFDALDRNRNGELDAAEFARFEGLPPSGREPFERATPAEGLPPGETLPPPR